MYRLVVISITNSKQNATLLHQIRIASLTKRLQFLCLKCTKNNDKCKYASGSGWVVGYSTRSHVVSVKQILLLLQGLLLLWRVLYSWDQYIMVCGRVALYYRPCRFYFTVRFTAVIVFLRVDCEKVLGCAVPLVLTVTECD